MLKKILQNKLFLATLSGLLFSLAWTEWGGAYFLFIAFIPLLKIEDLIYNSYQKRNNLKVFNYAYIAFFTWNIISTWWIYYASLFGAVGAIICNSFFMAFIFMHFHKVRVRLGNSAGYFSLILFWLAFEYIHLNWDLEWPWLTIGNGFANNIKIAQWYDFTGVLGGSLWVLIVNAFIFNIFFLLKSNTFNFKKKRLIFCSILVIVLIVPITISLIKYYYHEDKGKEYDFVVIQPNIDPYNEKFSGMTVRDQVVKLLNLADSIADNNVDFFVGPETALANTIWEENLTTDMQVRDINLFLKKYPNSEFILGASTRKWYKNGEKISETAKKFSDTAIYYDSYNTALMLDTNINNISIYHKSKLVIGVEKIPYPIVFGLLNEFAIDLGGTVGSLGVQRDRSVFVSKKDSVRIAPVICYESIFGEFVTGYVRNGANIITVITNDGWWEDTPGYKQHLSYSKLRAIETRRSVVRSANTGISCFINQRGDIINPTKWWESDAIRAKVMANSEITFYTYSGDYIGRIASFFSILLLIYFFVKKYTSRKM